FDIVHNTPCLMVPDAEVIKLVDEVLNEFPPFRNNHGFSFFISHVSIIEAIFDCCRIPPEVRNGVYTVLEQLGRGQSMAQIRNTLMMKYHLPRSVLDELELFDKRGLCVSEDFCTKEDCI